MLAPGKGRTMASNPAIEALLGAFQQTRDGRLLLSALDLSAQDADRRAVIAAALAAAEGGLASETRERLARAALDMGDALDALGLCGEDTGCLPLRVDA